MFKTVTGDFPSRRAVFIAETVDARVENRWLSSQNARDLNHGDTPSGRFREHVKPLVDLLRLFSGSVVICP